MRLLGLRPLYLHCITSKNKLIFLVLKIIFYGKHFHTDQLDLLPLKYSVRFYSQPNLVPCFTLLGGRSEYSWAFLNVPGFSFCSPCRYSTARIMGNIFPFFLLYLCFNPWEILFVDQRQKPVLRDLEMAQREKITGWEGVVGPGQVSAWPMSSVFQEQF